MLVSVPENSVVWLDKKFSVSEPRTTFVMEVRLPSALYRLPCPSTAMPAGVVTELSTMTPAAEGPLCGYSVTPAVVEASCT